jgi:cell division protein FtsQ
MKIKRAYWVLGIWIVIIAYFIVSFNTVVENDEQVCNEVLVKIECDEGKAFVTAEEVLSLLKKNKINPEEVDMSDIDLARIESLIAVHPSIARVDAYKTIMGKLCIEVEQRKPVMRIINNSNRSAYMDQNGVMMPTSLNHTAHVIVFAGAIGIPNNLTKKQESSEQIRELFQLAEYINDDELLSAQIEHVHVATNGELKLIPRVGKQVIYFGEAVNYERKFNKLKALYAQGFKKYGWTNYKAINLKYKNQVVCTKI